MSTRIRVCKPDYSECSGGASPARAFIAVLLIVFFVTEVLFSLSAHLKLSSLSLLWWLAVLVSLWCMLSRLRLENSALWVTDISTTDTSLRLHCMHSEPLLVVPAGEFVLTDSVICVRLHAVDQYSDEHKTEGFLRDVVQALVGRGKYDLVVYRAEIGNTLFHRFSRTLCRA